MPISFQCQCGKSYRVKDELGGKMVCCAVCNRVVAVPVEASLVVAEELVEVQPEEIPQAIPTQAIREAAPPLPPPPPLPGGEAAPPLPPLPPPPVAEEGPPPRPADAGFFESRVVNSRRRSKRRTTSTGSSLPINRSVGGGLIVMFISLILFCGLLMVGKYWAYPLILFCIGLGAAIKGCLGRN